MLADKQLVVISDLDGCLLNKADYDFSPAIPTIQHLQKREVPIILASSKTETEMRVIAQDLELRDAPLICENGGSILWSRALDQSNPENRTLLGASRTSILQVLQTLKAKYEFRSFEDLQVAGVVAATDLPIEKAKAALQRNSTEPLLWDDAESKIDSMAADLQSAGLSFTRGGRFWHVAGQTSKGAAMQIVVERLKANTKQDFLTIAIGDSPIDQTMLDVADFPIAIPDPDGLVHVTVSEHNGRIARFAGAEGWAESVGNLVNELNS